MGQARWAGATPSSGCRVRLLLLGHRCLARAFAGQLADVRFDEVGEGVDLHQERGVELHYDERPVCAADFLLLMDQMSLSAESRLNLPEQPRSRVSPPTLGRRSEMPRACAASSIVKPTKYRNLTNSAFGLSSIASRSRPRSPRAIGRDLRERRAIRARPSHAFEGAAVPPRPACAGLINEDASHRLRRRVEEVCAILPGGLLIAAEPQPGFMHQRGAWSVWPGDSPSNLCAASRRSSSYTSGSNSALASGSPCSARWRIR